MKKFYYIAAIIAVAFTGCDSANAPDCLKSSGKLTRTTLDVPPFSAIEVNTEFNVILQYGTEQAVSVSTGANLISEINYEVIDGELIVRDDNTCHWSKSYNFPTLHITHPNITNIRLGGSGLIKSDGILPYPNLHLSSKDQSGDFQLEVECEQLNIISNELTNFYLSGSASSLSVNFSSGDGRFEGADLTVKSANINHRGSNDIIIHVTESLSGVISSTGNIIYTKTKPAIIDVSDENRGNLIYQPE